MPYNDDRGAIESRRYATESAGGSGTKAAALGDESSAKECPACGQRMVIRVLDVPACQSCGWAGAIPVDENWNPIRS